MTDSRRVVLVKPGDVLMIGNLDVAPEDVEAFESALEPLREILGIPKIFIFADDIDLAVTSSAAPKPRWSRGEMLCAAAIDAVQAAGRHFGEIEPSEELPDA